MTLVELDEATVRAYVAALLCPWCGKGPWKTIAAHTNKAHGVSSQQLRDAAGYSTHVSMTDPSTFALQSANARANPHLPHQTGVPAPVRARAAHESVAEKRRRDAMRKGSDSPLRQAAADSNRTRRLSAETCRNGKHPKAVGSLGECIECGRETARRDQRRRKESPEGRQFTHGLSGRLNYGCKCEVCAEAYRTYKRDYRARKRMERGAKP